MIIFNIVLKKVISAFFLLLLMSAFVFWATNVGPGDAATRLAGKFSSESQIQLLRVEMKLDVPVYVQYGRWLNKAVHGDLGQSLSSRESVTSLLAPRARNTALLAIVAFLLYIPTTLLLASSAAAKYGRPWDHFVNAYTVVFLSLPDFVLGTILTIVFVLWIPIIPAFTDITSAKSLMDYVTALALPAITLATGMSAYAIRILRESLVDVLESDFVRMATLKGVKRPRRLMKHALPNALLPALSVSAINLAYVVGGVVVVEVVFRYPGIGSLFVASLGLRDSPLVAATALLGSASYVLANLVVDLLALVLVPKLRSK